MVGYSGTRLPRRGIAPILHTPVIFWKESSLPYASEFVLAALQMLACARQPESFGSSFREVVLMSVRRQPPAMILLLRLTAQYCHLARLGIRKKSMDD